MPVWFFLLIRCSLQCLTIDNYEQGRSAPDIANKLNKTKKTSLRKLLKYRLVTLLKYTVNFYG